MLHANFAIKYYITVPVVVEAEILLYWAFIRLDYFMYIKKILNGRSFSLDLELEHR